MPVSGFTFFHGVENERQDETGKALVPFILPFQATFTQVLLSCCWWPSSEVVPYGRPGLGSLQSIYAPAQYSAIAFGCLGLRLVVQTRPAFTASDRVRVPPVEGLLRLP